MGRLEINYYEDEDEPIEFEMDDVDVGSPCGVSAIAASDSAWASNRSKIKDFL